MRRSQALVRSRSEVRKITNTPVSATHRGDGGTPVESTPTRLQPVIEAARRKNLDARNSAVGLVQRETNRQISQASLTMRMACIKYEPRRRMSCLTAEPKQAVPGHCALGISMRKQRLPDCRNAEHFFAKSQTAQLSISLQTSLRECFRSNSSTSSRTSTDRNTSGNVAARYHDTPCTPQIGMDRGWERAGARFVLLNLPIVLVADLVARNTARKCVVTAGIGGTTADERECTVDQEEGTAKKPEMPMSRKERGLLRVGRRGLRVKKR